MQYTSEAESFWLDLASRVVCAFPIPYVQAAILNLHAQSLYTELLLHFVIAKIILNMHAAIYTELLQVNFLN